MWLYILIIFGQINWHCRVVGFRMTVEHRNRIFAKTENLTYKCCCVLKTIRLTTLGQSIASTNKFHIEQQINFSFNNCFISAWHVEKVIKIQFIISDCTLAKIHVSFQGTALPVFAVANFK